jgi:hypothetical protein
MRIYRGLHNTALLLYRYHKVKARSGTKAAACSNRYATDKRAAAAANTDLAVRPTLITTSIPRLAGFIKAFAHKFKGFTNQQKVVLFFCKLICRYLKNHAVVGIMVVYLDKQKS